MRDDVRAAYVPWVAELEGDPAPVRAAAAFLADAAPDLEPVLVAPSRFMASQDAVSEFASGARVVVTPKNLDSVRDSHGSPVLVYKPTLKELVIAMRHRGAQPIAVVEANDISWAAWAAEIAALNLLDNTVLTPPTRTAAQRGLFDAIDHVGNNGWADDPSRRDLRRMLKDLSDLGPINKDELVAYQLVHPKHRARSFDALVRLGAEIGRVSG